MKSIIARVESKLLSRSVRRARVHSNQIVSSIAPLATGHVINVSAWRDEDKQGRRYREYFCNADSYSRSNFVGWRGTADGSDDDIELDLVRDLPTDLRSRFDFVYNHTTLEHVYDFRKAFSTLAALSRDALLVVVPAVQPLHGPEDADFWRFSPYAMRRLYLDNGFELLVEDFGPSRGFVKYLTCFGVRAPQVWAARMRGAGVLPGVDPCASARRLPW